MLKTIQMILSLSPVRNLPPSGDQKRNFYFRIFYPTQSFYSSVERAKFQAPFAPQTPFIFFFFLSDVLRRFLKSYFPPSSPPFWRAILNINERKRERARKIFSVAPVRVISSVAPANAITNGPMTRQTPSKLLV